MKALVYRGPCDIGIEDRATPQSGPSEVLVKVRASGICGSDLHGYLGKTGRRIPPMVMGHEFAGEVAGAGQDATHFKPGDRVVVQPVIFCGTCEPCSQGLTNFCGQKQLFGVMDLDGSMAEYVAVPERLLYRLPDHVDFVSAALTEPLAVAYSATRKVDVEGRDVLVIGSGTIGLMILQALCAAGARSIYMVDITPSRLDLAMRMGASGTINPAQEDFDARVSAVTGGRGFDVVFEAVGATPTVQQSTAALKIGGTAVWVGNSARMVSVDMQQIVTRALTVIGTYTYTHAEFGEALDLIASGKVALAPLVSRVEPLERGAEMFQLQTSGQADVIKVILVS